jgi:hypothetical protein
MTKQPSKKPAPRKLTDLEKVLQKYATIEKLLKDCQQLLLQNGQTLAQMPSGALPGAAAADNTLDDRDALVIQAMNACAAARVYIVPREWLAVLSRISPKSSPFRTSLAKLLKVGRLRKAGVGSVTLSDTWTIDSAVMPMRTEEIARCITEVFSRQDADILSHLANNPQAGDSSQGWIHRKTLAEAIGQSAESSAFRDRLTQLRKQGFIEFGGNQAVRITLQWFRPQVQP